MHDSAVATVAPRATSKRATTEASVSSSVPNNSTLKIQNSTLSAAQLALLNQATITIADLADGYLALTLGTTITLDTDAAGYGWFIDPTPFTNEEFVNEGSMVDGQWSIGSDSSRLAVHDSRLPARRLGNSWPSQTAPQMAR